MTQENEVIVDEEGNLVEQNKDETPPKSEEAILQNGEDSRLSSEEDHEDDEQELAAGKTDEEREAIRAARREERQRRKQAQRERETTLRRELAARDELIGEMRQRLDNVERRGAGADVAQLDQAIKQSADAYAYFKGQLQEATTSQNGQLAAEATEKMILAQRRAEDLARIKQAYVGQQQRPTQPRPLDPRLKANAESWAERNTWYDVDGRDLDSRVAASVDAALHEEGWDPTKKEYWEELDTRLKKYLPHRYSLAHNKGTGGQRSPVAASGRQEAAGNGKGTFTLSPDRVKAIKEAGKWEDPKERASMIKAYRDYDRQNAEQR